jgi:hypothetical protein
MAWNPFEMWYGRDKPPPAIVRLKAGEIDVEFQDGDLRYIQYAGRELIRRIYVAIRDVNWNTIPANMTNLAIDSEADRFHVQFDAFHQTGSLEYRWHASIEGKPDGIIEYTMEGLAERDFRYCRIGFCVLYPIEGIAGSPYHVVAPEGTFSGVLPRLVEPQRIVNGFEVPMTPSCSSLTIAMADGTKSPRISRATFSSWKTSGTGRMDLTKHIALPLPGIPAQCNSEPGFPSKSDRQSRTTKKSEGVGSLIVIRQSA